jgi:hypothetical protein
MTKGLVIPFEVADGITLAALKDQHKYLKEETRLHLEEGQWLHPEDLAKNRQLIPALELLIPYYGGEL